MQAPLQLDMMSVGLVYFVFLPSILTTPVAGRFVARLGARMRARMQQAHTPRGRVQAIIDANLAAEEFDRRTGTAWWPPAPRWPSNPTASTPSRRG